MDIQQLQQQHPVFSYDRVTYEYAHDALIFTFYYTCGEHTFTPKIRFQNAPEISSSTLSMYGFHMGLSQIPTYWKAFCSQTIEIKAGFLSNQQIDFWKKLFFHGMGEFFYINQITPFFPEFVVHGKKTEIKDKADTQSAKQKRPAIIVPVGGGKDSIVTLELLANAGYPIWTLSAHQGSSLSIIKTFAARHQLVSDIVINRDIDPHLLELNEKGHPNGHTPFSSQLAFTVVSAARFFDIPYIALSNEKSANENTGTYAGVEINHQYSKSYEFEKDFRQYVHNSFNDAPYYFSFMRPLYELAIVKLFTNYPEYFSIFHSCNVGLKTDTWCGKCAKCTFVALMLSAFLDDATLYTIFSTDVLSNPDNQLFLDELLGKTEYKPFECVGTVDETWAALYLAYTKRKAGKIPRLIATYKKEIEENAQVLKALSHSIVRSFSLEHSIPSQFETILKHAIK